MKYDWKRIRRDALRQYRGTGKPWEREFANASFPIFRPRYRNCVSAAMGFQKQEARPLEQRIADLEASIRETDFLPAHVNAEARRRPLEQALAKLKKERALQTTGTDLAGALSGIMEAAE